MASIGPQLEADDEVIIIGDTLDNQSLTVTRDIVRRFPSQFRFIEYAGVEHTWGHDQLNYGISQARGAYIHCNDDDDIWTADAAASMRRAIRAAPGMLFFFRFLSWHSYTYWDSYGLLAENHVGGHCLVCPNVPGKVGRWTARYQGDFDYIMDTVTRNGGIDSVVWRDEVVAIARPNLIQRQEVLDTWRSTRTAEKSLVCGS